MPHSENHTDDSTSITLEDVARLPLPGMAVPADIAFSPDDRLVTYLFSPQRDLTNQLYAFDPQSGRRWVLVTPPDGGTTEENVSPEEALRRERQRQLAVGVTRYQWAGSAKPDRLLIPLHGEVWAADGPDYALRRVAEAQGKPILDPQFSPDGEWIAYVQDAEVFVISSRSGPAGPSRQVTSGARESGKTHGLAEFIAQEEMGRSRGFWWSADSRWIAFTEVDETHIPVYRILHQGKDATGEAAQEDHRYPFTGQANARVRLGVVSREGGEPVWMDLGDETEERYLARVDWLPDGQLAAQLENREQSELQLVRFDPRTGRGETLLVERSEVWINLNDLFRPLETGEFIWGSERSGFQHLYLYDSQGSLIRALTGGDWIVDSIAGVDEAARQVYFTGNRESPLEAHLYAVSLDGGEIRRITQESGTHAAVLDHACRRFVDTYQSSQQPPVVRLCSIEDGKPVQTLFDEPDPRVEKMQLQPPELITIQNRAGVTLYGAIYYPPARFGQGPHPAIVSAYGGPHVQLVSSSWRVTAAMRAQYLSRLGYLVFVLDNRGSARRGLAFEGAIRHNLGSLEVEDQVDGVRWLVEQGLADPQRVGIYGWSYGGYLSAMCLARAPETFQAAVAGAPVTHMDGYDTHYTERYMGTPQSNPAGYAESSVMAHVEQMTGRLLIVHGLIDENVHFRHTARLINALIRARKPYELVLFPDERHSPRKLADRVYMEERIRDFFLDALPVGRSDQ